MEKRSIICWSTGTAKLSFILGTTFWVATFLSCMVLTFFGDTSSQVEYYFLLASTVFCAITTSSYMMMTASYLDNMTEAFVERQATFTKEEIANKLRPYNSPFAYSVSAVAMGVTAYALGEVLTPSQGLSPKPHAAFLLSTFGYLYVFMMAIAFTLARYKVIKRLLGMLPSVDAWKDEDSCLQMKSDLESDDLIWQIRIFKPW